MAIASWPVTGGGIVNQDQVGPATQQQCGGQSALRRQHEQEQIGTSAIVHRKCDRGK